MEKTKKKIEENNNVQVLEKETNKDKQEDIEQDQIKQEIIQFEPLKNKNTTLSILLVTIAIITIIYKNATTSCWQINTIDIIFLIVPILFTGLFNIKLFIIKL